MHPLQVLTIYARRKNMSKKNSGRRVWRGVTTATASLLALSVCASTVVDGFRTDIDKFLRKML